MNDILMFTIADAIAHFKLPNKIRLCINLTEGTPEDITQSKASFIAKYLAEKL